ncbi:biotin-dependent carboxyltransferase family protein [Ornithinimicrobium sp. LYQ92]|uniref:5-oxoprolinase subunit C family protein n=1 Tax=Serinicoccus sp. LYQ92 TaxID=3378798 RepID=UPI00385266BE
MNPGQRALKVLAVGPQVLVQDLGRPGVADVGVGRSGAADRSAHRLGARLLAQEESRAGLEILLGGLRVRAVGQLTVCLTGALAPMTVDGSRVPHGAPVLLPDGAELAVGNPTQGLRSYLAVRGGISVDATLGSRSHDTLSGLGPPPVRAGQRLPVGAPPSSLPFVDQAVPGPAPDPLVLDVLPGPRRDWLADPAALAAAAWTVTDRSDRVGTRLDGPPLVRAEAYQDAELPSEPMVRGAVQVPGDGRPVVFGADHPVTGGYPVVGVLTEVGADRLAQTPPGRSVTLRWV